MKLDSFTTGYVECALWSSTGDNDEPLDQIDAKLAPETLGKMVVDCQRFQAEHAELLEQAREVYGDTHAGHDFWLTRHGHGAGFWDRDLPEELGDKLTEAAKAFGEFNLYVGDDGQIYS